MKGRWLWAVIVVNLLVLLALMFVYPHLMVSPGRLMPAHATLSTDCFACHAPLRGASAGRCTTCHAPADIGLRTSQGVAIKTASKAGGTRLRASFHQQLTEQNCTACHTDHADPQLTRRSQKSFSHALLRVEARDQCSSCHMAPSNALHKKLQVSCAQCHSSQAWKPATFEHNKLFVLDNDHNAPCAICHVANNFAKYTCYGCHEHTPANITRKHVKEGINNFENCVECHRSANDEPEGKGSREGEKDRQGRGRD